ncbi:hypothetical protein JKP88DRAFT_222358 [Tribonema minus]|uniref:Uncharacterized protein n=1 Tax=Tribonema minus TaxID=303371 RepID=A0A836CF20_9STRA|nr:hypothetical protein JKP88DRAFT_222358 [Tribonema minus]
MHSTHSPSLLARLQVAVRVCSLVCIYRYAIATCAHATQYMAKLASVLPCHAFYVLDTSPSFLTRPTYCVRLRPTCISLPPFSVVYCPMHTYHGLAAIYIGSLVSAFTLSAVAWKDSGWPLA